MMLFRVPIGMDLLPWSAVNHLTTVMMSPFLMNVYHSKSDLEL
jgi:hypothetical protein